MGSAGEEADAAVALVRCGVRVGLRASVWVSALPYLYRGERFFAFPPEVHAPTGAHHQSGDLESARPCLEQDGGWR